MFTLRTLLIIGALGLSSVACVSQRTTNAPVAVITLPNTSEDGANTSTAEFVTEASAQLSREQLLALAENETGIAATGYYLELAQRELDSGYIASAKNYLAKTTAMPKDANSHLITSLISTRIAILERDFDTAEKKARFINANTLSNENQIRLDLAKAAIDTANGGQDGIHILERACISQLQAIEYACWTTASNMAQTFRSENTAPPPLQSKAALIISQLVATNNQPFALNFIDGRLFSTSSDDALERAMATLSQKPTPVIGALLPISSRFATAAKSTYLGMQASIEVLDPGKRPRLVLIDIGDNANDINHHLEHAKSQGVNIFVGPLGTEYATTVNHALIGNEAHLVLSGECSYNLQESRCAKFALSPESEAHFIFEKLVELGYKSPVVIYSQNRWGERFRSELIRLSIGMQLKFSPFPMETEDFTEIVKPIFEYGTLDSVIIAATAHHARLIKPQITFHANSKVPVLATSTIYDGTQNPIQDIDLSGTQVPLLPIDDIDDPINTNLQLSAAKYWPNPPSDSLRFYALGHDTVLLADKIFNNIPIYNLAGRTGLLTTNDKTIIRELEWGRFSDGLVEKERSDEDDQNTNPNTHDQIIPDIGSNNEEKDFIKGDIETLPTHDEQSIIKGDYD